MEKNLSVVLIAHNEEESIARMVQGLLDRYDREIFEVVVIDDASTDNTTPIVEELMRRNNKVRLIRKDPPCGVGRALKTGLQNVNPEVGYVLTMDSDFVENIEEVHLLIDSVEQNGCDGVVGSRFLPQSRLVGYPLLKKCANRLFHLVVRVLFKIKQKDLTNNFKLYKREVFQSLPWRSDGFSFNAETGILPLVSNYSIREVPVSWVGRKPHQGISKFHVFRDGRNYLSVLFYALKVKSRVGQ